MNFRLTVRDVFTLADRGTVVIGYIDDGSVTAGDWVEVARSGVRVAVSSVEGVRDADWRPGDPAAIGLLVPRLALADVAPGDELRAVTEPT